MKIATSIRLQSFAAALALSLCGAAAHAAEESDTITTDRPGLVESAKTVGKGRFQIETSIARERNSDAGVRTTTFTTPTLLRYGVSPALELRFESDGYTRQRTVDTGASTDDERRGGADASIGVKWAMQEGEGAVPSIGWLLHADLDTGARAFRGEGLRPSLRTVFEWELPADFSLGVMPGLIYDKLNGDRFTAGILGVAVGKEWTERFRTFVGVSAQSITSSRHGGSVVTYDVGGAYLITKTIQIDTLFLWGANRFSPDFAWTVGLSVKF